MTINLYFNGDIYGERRVSLKNRDFPGSIEEIPAEEVRSHLERVLASPQFRISKRCHRFLNYVVNEVIEGKADSLKERTLATDVFDRPASWDSGEDTIVRGGAREVRKRLAQYYASAEGKQDRVRFELAPGSYVPVFTYAEAAEIVAAPELLRVPPVALPEPPLARSRGPWVFWLTAASLLAVSAAVIAPRLRPVSAFDEFWKPLWNSPYPLTIAMAHPIVYQPSTGAARLSDQRPRQLVPSEMDGSDMAPVPDQYVAYGDASAVSEMSVLMGRHSRSVRLRPADKIDFADLREAPAVLIGGFSNHWTMELTEPFRFHFGLDSGGGPALLDSTRPTLRWNIPSKTDNGVSSDDYFLVGRLAHSPSGKIMLVAAGLTQFGTEAAGHFLTDPNRVNDTFHKIPANWQNRNVEIVFHAKVVENAASGYELVAWHVW